MATEIIEFTDVPKNGKIINGFITQLRSKVEELFTKRTKTILAENPYDKVRNALEELGEQTAAVIETLEKRGRDKEANPRVLIAERYIAFRKNKNEFVVHIVRDEQSMKLLRNLPGERILDVSLRVVLEQDDTIQIHVTSSLQDDAAIAAEAGGALHALLHNTRELAEGIADELLGSESDIDRELAWHKVDMEKLLYGDVAQAVILPEVDAKSTLASSIDYIVSGGTELVLDFFNSITRDTPHDLRVGADNRQARNVIHAFLDWLRELLATGQMSPLYFYTTSRNPSDYENGDYVFGWTHSYSQLMRTTGLSNYLSCVIARSSANEYGLVTTWTSQDWRLARHVFVEAAARRSLDDYAASCMPGGKGTFVHPFPFAHFRKPSEDEYSGEKFLSGFAEFASDTAVQILSGMRDMTDRDVLVRVAETRKHVFQWLRTAMSRHDSTDNYEGDVGWLLLDGMSGEITYRPDEQPRRQLDDMDNVIVIRLETIQQNDMFGARLAVHRPALLEEEL